MFCPQCGTVNADLDRYCIACHRDLIDMARAQASGTPLQPAFAGASSVYPAYQSGSESAGYQSGYLSGEARSSGPVGYTAHTGTDHPNMAYEGAGYQQPAYQQAYPGYGAPSYQAARSPVRPISAVRSYLGWAITVLILCWLPGGIVAVVYASQVSGKLAAGDYEGAMHSSRRAKMWCWISFGVLLASLVLGLVIALSAGRAGVALRPV